MGEDARKVGVASKLAGFDAYMEKTVEDWNAPGVGIGVVVGEQLVFAKGYGYRDYGKRLAFTPKTVCPIASNTKLFTAVAAGLLVEEGKLTWDKPVREAVREIEFYNHELNHSVTLRDMLSHRTGITRHDSVWYKSEFTRQELFERLKYLEPSHPLRQTYLYNNMMYAGVGHIVELQSGMTWESLVRRRILQPLGMRHTGYTVADLKRQPDHGVPYTEKRDTSEIYKIPYYDDTVGVAPAGAIVSSIEDMSHWLAALMNEGRYKGRQVIPREVLKATLEPAIPHPNAMGEARGYWEMLNAAYGMGRDTVSYRGHLLSYHGGYIDGFHSQVSCMPQEKIGVIALAIGDHCGSLPNCVSYQVYERLLGMEPTPWNERFLAIRRTGKKEGTEARAKAGQDQVKKTRPAHALADYAGEYEHPAYGVLKIGLKKQLVFDFHTLVFPLTHFHYERFDTPDDERYGRWSVNFLTNPQGDVDKAVMSLDEAEATFTRRPVLPERAVLRKLAGTYVTQSGFKFRVVLKETRGLFMVVPGQPDSDLVPYKGLTFRTKEFSNVTFEFVMEKRRVVSLKQRDPSGEFIFQRQ